MILMTPADAFEPQIPDWAPFNTSIRSTSDNNNELKMAPPVPIGLVISTPSTKTSTERPDCPRIKIEVFVPKPPLRTNVIPGILVSASFKVR